MVVPPTYPLGIRQGPALVDDGKASWWPASYNPDVSQQQSIGKPDDPPCRVGKKQNVKGKARRGPERTTLERFTVDAMSDATGRCLELRTCLMTKSHDDQLVTLGLAKENQYSDGTELDWPNGVALLVLFFALTCPRNRQLPSRMLD